MNEPEKNNQNRFENRPVAVVTGANVGIGYHTARELAAKGFKVILACRDSGRGSNAEKSLSAELPDSDVEFSLLNLASLHSIAEFAERFAANHSQLDILVNNAAVMAIPERTLSADGFELQFATNHLGHFALTARLLPLLRQAQKARVVTVSSIAHRYGSIDFDDLNHERGYEGWAAYGTTKLCNLLFAFELARRAERNGLTLLSVAAHPGVSKTNILKNGPTMGKKVLRTRISDVFAKFFAQTDKQGALPIIHACLADSVNNADYFGPDGLFEVSGKPNYARTTSQSRDENLASRLWAVSEELTGLTLL